MGPITEEAAMLGVAYSIILGFFYREMSLNDLIRNIRESAYSVSLILLIVAGAFLFSRIITLENVPNIIANFFISISHNNPYLFLLALNILLLIVGCFFEAVSAMIIIVPIVLPIAEALNINFVHLGVIIVFNLMIGLLTPPMGLGLYMISEIAGITFKRLVRAILPFYIPLIITLLLITYFPFIVLYVPRLIFGN